MNDITQLRVNHLRHKLGKESIIVFSNEKQIRLHPKSGYIDFSGIFLGKREGKAMYLDGLVGGSKRKPLLTAI